MLLLWAILTLFASLVFFMIAYTGVALAVSFFSQVCFFLAFVSLMTSIVLFIMERHKLKVEHKRMLEASFVEKEKKIGRELGKEIRQEIREELGKDIGKKLEKEFETEIEKEIEKELKK